MTIDTYYKMLLKQGVQDNHKKEGEEHGLLLGVGKGGYQQSKAQGYEEVYARNEEHQPQASKHGYIKNKFGQNKPEYLGMESKTSQVKLGRFSRVTKSLSAPNAATFALARVNALDKG